MNITKLIKAGKLEPVLKNDARGVTMLLGWRRKEGSRKTGEWWLRRELPWVDHNDLTPGARIIMDERIRQVKWEGWTAAHDDQHTDGSLAKAAACYAMEPSERNHLPGLVQIPDSWPWGAQWWKPCPDDRIRELTKAGALYIAEAERLKRAGDDAGSTAMNERALECAKKIDDAYNVGPLSPGPHMLRK